MELSYYIPALIGQSTLHLHSGRPAFIVGGNGTGKSALLTHLVNQTHQNLIYIPGSRPNYFDNENLSINPASRRQIEVNLLGWNRSPDMRWRAVYGAARNEKIIHDLLTAEADFKIGAANDIADGGSASPAVAKLQRKVSPLDEMNRLLEVTGLPVRLKVVGGEMMAAREGSIYSIAKMSDGERAAVTLASEVRTARSDTVFIVDEPELHIHRSIVVPLVRALILERPDCIFIVCTHELDLPGSVGDATVVLLRGCVWQHSQAHSWDIDVVDSSQDIPEDIRVDVLGSRRKVLFVEGREESLGPVSA